MSRANPEQLRRCFRAAVLLAAALTLVAPARSLAGLAERRSPIVIAAEKVKSAVVNISTEALVQRRAPGELDRLFEEFFRALAFNAGVTLHMTLKAGTNAHHVAEACFKAAARALREAVEPDPRAAGAVPSTKGVLEA